MPIIEVGIIGIMDFSLKLIYDGILLKKHLSDKTDCCFHAVIRIVRGGIVILNFPDATSIISFA